MSEPASISYGIASRYAQAVFDIARENGKLWAMLKTAGADAAWRAYGVDVTEGWREDGFVLAYEPEDGDAGEKAAVDLAVKYGQGAIYAYSAVNNDAGLLRRRTVPAAMSTRSPRPAATPTAGSACSSSWSWCW
mgnify:CR=1 FL=1